MKQRCPHTALCRRYVGAGLWLFLTMSLSATALAGDYFTPDKGDVSGGAWIYLQDYYYKPLASVEFDGVASPQLEAYTYGADEDGVIYSRYRAKLPPHATVGDVIIGYLYESNLPGTELQFFPESFKYVDTPLPTAVSPSQHSIITDDFPVTISCDAVSVQPGVQVYFGSQAASQVVVDERGTEIVCVAPPFPGGAYPMPVDIRVVNPDGKDGVLSGKYEYNRVTPTILYLETLPIRSWSSGQSMEIFVRHLVHGNIQVYFDGVPASVWRTFCCDHSGNQSVICIAPPHAPGVVDVTVMNGDGGMYTKVGGALYEGPPSADFHTADLNHNFRIEISELLRAIQFFNVGSFHCEPGSEDGFAPGDGNESCPPYASDHDPQDWKISLSEVLELVQFYNLYCYQPCPGAPGTYCPPD